MAHGKERDLPRLLNGASGGQLFVRTLLGFDRGIKFTDGRRIDSCHVVVQVVLKPFPCAGVDAAIAGLATMVIPGKHDAHGFVVYHRYQRKRRNGETVG